MLRDYLCVRTAELSIADIGFVRSRLPPACDINAPVGEDGPRRSTGHRRIR